MTAIALPRPGELDQAQLVARCDAIDVWAAYHEDVAELQDARAKLSAIDKYLAQTSIDGRARLAASMRRLEIRIGILLGPPERGGDRGNQHTGGKSTANDLPLTKDERSQFRSMAEHQDLVEDEIAKSTDAKPASRATVLRRIAGTTEVRQQAWASIIVREVVGLNRTLDGLGMDDFLAGLGQRSEQDLAQWRDEQLLPLIEKLERLADQPGVRHLRLVVS